MGVHEHLGRGGWGGSLHVRHGGRGVGERGHEWRRGIVEVRGRDGVGVKLWGVGVVGGPGLLHHG